LNKYILTLDIGGTTFSSGLFDEALNQVKASTVALVSNFTEKHLLIDGFVEQINQLLTLSDLEINQVLGLGVSAPGPLDAKEGKILKTPNLILLQNTHLADELEKRLELTVHIENDANLFAWGEWHKNHLQSKVIVTITLGSGLGVGVIVNGTYFTGAHGMGAEYGISPLSGGVWEDYISIEGLSKKSREISGNLKSPRELYDAAIKGDKEALKIWHWFGNKLGYCLSHIVNMLDPELIVVGGGISKAFSLFINSTESILHKHSPSFTKNGITIEKCPHYLESIHRGAALLIQDKMA